MGLICNYTEEEIAEFELDVENAHRQQELLELKDKRILHKQRRKLSPYLLSQLESILTFYETTWGYEVVQDIGENAVKAIEDFNKLRHIFTDVDYQGYESGEVSCGGTIWVPIRNGNYFKFEFGM